MTRETLGFVAHPLDALLHTRSHVAILRALHHDSSGMTGREVARAAGLTHKAANDSLARLEWAGVVRRAAAGRAYLFTLNRRHWLVRRGILPLLDVERQFGERIRDLLREEFAHRLVSGAIFGSTARGEESPKSDLDVCLVVEDDRRKEGVSRLASDISERLSEEFGVHLAPLVFTRREFARGYRGRNAFFVNVVKEGEVFAGRDLREVAAGQEN